MNLVVSEFGNRTYHVPQRHMELLPNYYAWTYSRIAPILKGVVVELGCGAGLGIPNYLNRVERIYAVDYNEELIRRVAQTWPDPRVVPIQADLCSEWSKLDGIRADAVVMMDLLEHFEADGWLLGQAGKLLKPGGHLAVKVPAQPSLFSAMDTASGHYRRYDRHDVIGLGHRAGLQLVSIRSIDPVGALVYRLKKRKGRRTNFSLTFAPWQLRLINLGLPALSLLDYIPGLPGLSFVAIFRR